MQLWNDYEGRIIAEAYPLDKLLSPEGRSAFFSTSNGTGTPAVIRIIEAHFDEAEILARWRQVAEIKQPNLVELRKCGEAVLDGTALVYAVMEPTEANLADVLRDRPLTLEETQQIATSLVAALGALHARNLIHEHVEPANVLAVGEVIKLRSDCIRETPDGQEGDDLKAADVRDLAVVLLQSLTLQRTLPGTPLPAPFHEIIPNGLSGAWGLQQIAAALTPAAPAYPKPFTSPASTSMPAPKSATPIASTPARGEAAASKSTPAAPFVRDRIVNSVEPASSHSRGLWVAGGVATLFLLFLIWHFVHSSTATTKNSPQEIPTLATVGRDNPSGAPANAAPTHAAPSSRPSIAAKSAPDGHTRWRVVAYTYNREDQARQKAGLIARQHSSLNPEVFTPTGHAPFLVTVGGPMTREQAEAFKKKARAAGLPRDIYTQNYAR